MPKIFISYRRADSRKDSGRIYDRLVDAFGKDNIFKDVDNIPFGRDFRGVLSEAVNQCQVMLAVIGQQWLTITDTDGSRRLDNPADFVRIEIQSGLQRGDARCLVIPVIVDNAAMPNADKLPLELRELAFKNAITVRDDPDFHRDMERLVRQLQQYDIELKTREHVPVTQKSGANKAAQSHQADSPDVTSNPLLRFLKSPIGIALAILILLLLVFLLSQFIPRGSTTPTPTVAALSASDTPQTSAMIPTITDTLTLPPPQVPTREPSAVPTYTVTPTIAPTPLPPTATLTQTPSNTPTATNPPTQTAMPVITHNADWKIFEQSFNGVPMMQVPAGCFDMGSEQGADDEKPVTKICFDHPYWIDKTEVTNAQFAQFGGNAAKSSTWTDPNRPRETITWFEASDFCELRGGHLPTEAEWEYAARGPDNLTFPWGNDFNTANAVYSDNANNQTAAVGSKPSGASWVGALDMSGNVWEWVSTLYKAYPYPVPGSYDERHNWIAADNTSNLRTLRGGSWNSPGDGLRAAYHIRSGPLYSNSSLGFRCAIFAPNF